MVKTDEQLADLNGRLQAVRQKEDLRYDTKKLAGDVRREVTAIVRGEKESEVFYKNILDRMTVFRENRVEVRLNLLTNKWVFVLGKLQKSSPDTACLTEKLQRNAVHYDPSVPISVSKPLSSG